MPLGGGGIAKRRADALIALPRGRGFVAVLHDGDLPGFLNDDLGATIPILNHPADANRRFLEVLGGALDAVGLQAVESALEDHDREVFLVAVVAAGVEEADGLAG